MFSFIHVCYGSVRKVHWKECIVIMYLMPLVIYHTRNQLQLFFSWCSVLFLGFELVRLVSSLKFENALSCTSNLPTYLFSVVCLWRSGQSNKLCLDYHPFLLFLTLSNGDIHVNSNIYKAYLDLKLWLPVNLSYARQLNLLTTCFN